MADNHQSPDVVDGVVQVLARASRRALMDFAGGDHVTGCTILALFVRELTIGVNDTRMIANLLRVIANDIDPDEEGAA